MRWWPETATAIAVRRTATAIAARRIRPRHCQIAAPFGLNDLFNLILRPTPAFAAEKYRSCLDHVHTKGWLATWPRLR